MFEWLRRARTSSGSVRASTGNTVSAPLSVNDLAAALREALSGGNGGGPINETTAMRIAAFNGCVRLLGGVNASLPFHMRQVDGADTVTLNDHPVARLFRDRPNDFMTPSVFKRLIMQHKLVAGNFYALIVRSPRNRQITDLLPFDPWRMEIIVREDGEKVFRYATKNGQRDYAARDVFHVMGPSLDGYRGLSVLGFARETLAEADAARAQGVNLFRNGLRHTGTLDVPTALPPKKKPEPQADFKRFQPGGDLEGEVLILEHGMKFTPVSINPADAEWMEARKMTRVEIAMFFGVPLFMLGDTEKSGNWGSSLEQQSIAFVNFCLQPHLTEFEDAVNAMLEPGDPAFAHMDSRGLLRGDTQTRWNAYKIARDIGVASSNDIARLEDMPAHEGGDDDYLISSGARLQSEAQQPAAPPSNEARP